MTEIVTCFVSNFGLLIFGIYNSKFKKNKDAGGGSGGGNPIGNLIDFCYHLIYHFFNNLHFLSLCHNATDYKTFFLVYFLSLHTSILYTN